MQEITISSLQQDFKRAFTRNRIIAAVGLFIAALIVSPLLYMILKGIIGLFALFIAGIVGIGIFASMPVLTMKFANWRLSAIKGEAKKNPILTMQNVAQKKREALRAFKDQLESFRGDVLQHEAKLSKFKRQYPKEAHQYEAQQTKMQQLLRLREEKLIRADHQLDLFEGEIEKAAAIWDMALSAISLSEKAGLQTGDVFERIKVETSLDSVQRTMNHALAQVETAMLEERMDQPLQLEDKHEVGRSVGDHRIAVPVGAGRAV